MIYSEVTRSQFVEAFRSKGRGGQFSHSALDALYTELEAVSSLGEDIELDVIALCCDYTEEPFTDAARTNGLAPRQAPDEYDRGGEDDAAFARRVTKEIQAATQVVWTDDSSILYANY